MSAAALVLIALADVVSIGWARPDDPLEWTRVAQYPTGCPPPAGALPDTSLQRPASGEQSVTFRQASTGCHCYRITSWAPQREVQVVGEHERCAPVASCH